MRSPHFTHTKMLIAVFILQMAVMLLSFGEACAAYDVTISTAPSANVTIDEGSPYTWTSSGPAANISVYELQAKLNNGYDVEIVTGAAGNEAGNINVNAAFSWNDATILTLYAEQDININAVISASGPQSALTMTGNVKVGFKSGEANGFAGRVDFPGRIGVGFLKINNADYTVINSLGAQGSNTGTDLQGMRGNLAGYYALGADIDASTTSTWNGGAGFEPIGNSTNSFSGVFDGLGHAITGLTINRPTAVYVGLFGYNLNTTLRNVGLVGGNVTGNDYAGGLVGYAEVSSVVGSINNCYNSGAVSGFTVGGLAGFAGGLVNTTYTTGTVNGNSVVGGLVGDNDAVITSSYAKGAVVGTYVVGGLVGNNFSGAISDSYSTGSVLATDMGAGGLVGINYVSINKSYAVGNVMGAVPTGGLVGFNDGGTVIASFWDTQTSGQATSDGGTGSTTADMKQFATFSSAGWDISSSDSIWSIVDGQSYPFLRRFAPLPAVATASATAVAATSATLNSSINANGADASVSFQYGTSTAYGTTVSAAPVTVSGSGNTLVSASISGLTPGLSYHYRVVATNSAGTSYGADGVFTTPKAIVTVTLGNLSQAYNGTARSITVTTNPTGLTVNVTYGGSAAAPTNAGSYAVVATISDSMYQGSASGTLIIAKAPVTVTLGNLSQVYNGTARSATATTDPSGKTVTFTYNNSSTIPVNAGSYTVVGTVNDANYGGSANGTLIIGKALATVTLGGLSQTYNGTPRSVTATTTPAGKSVNFTYNGSATAPTAAGTYSVVGTVTDVNYSGSASGTLVIAPAAATITLQNLIQTYNGAARPVTATTTPAGLGVSFTYDASATVPTSAGSYAVVATITDPNYSGSKSGTLTVSKATATVTLSGLSQTYGGTSRSVIVTTNPVGPAYSVIYNGGSALPVNAGSYAVSVTVNDPNYSGGASGTLVVAPAAATVTLSGLNQTYDGSARPVAVTTSPAGLAVSVTYNGGATIPVNASSYAVAATVTNSNYVGSASGTLTIAKAAATVTLSNLRQYYDGSAKAVTVATIPSGLSFDVTYGDSGEEPVLAGSYALEVTIVDDNYAGDASGTLEVVMPSLTVAVSASGTQPSGVGGTITSSPAGISCSNSKGGTVVTCSNPFLDSVILYATPSTLSTFAGWGGACSGLGTCTLLVDSDKTVTAAFNQATLLHIDGTTYPSLQAAYNAASSGSIIQLLDNSIAGTLDAGRNVSVTLKGGYDAGYTATPGMTTLTAPLTVRSGAVIVDRIVIK